jgi:hypothetical protein
LTFLAERCESSAGFSRDVVPFCDANVRNLGTYAGQSGRNRNRESTWESSRESTWESSRESTWESSRASTSKIENYRFEKENDMNNGEFLYRRPGPHQDVGAQENAGKSLQCQHLFWKLISEV